MLKIKSKRSTVKHRGCGNDNENQPDNPIPTPNPNNQQLNLRCQMVLEKYQQGDLSKHVLLSTALPCINYLTLSQKIKRIDKIFTMKD